MGQSFTIDMMRMTVVKNVRKTVAKIIGNMMLSLQIRKFKLYFFSLPKYTSFSKATTWEGTVWD